jgi:ABC-type uncharacterized transport system ATPase subunit
MTVIKMSDERRRMEAVLAEGLRVKQEQLVKSLSVKLQHEEQVLKALTHYVKILKGPQPGGRKK